MGITGSKAGLLLGVGPQLHVLSDDVAPDHTPTCLGIKRKQPKVLDCCPAQVHPGPLLLTEVEGCSHPGWTAVEPVRGLPVTGFWEKKPMPSLLVKSGHALPLSLPSVMAMLTVQCVSHTQFLSAAQHRVHPSCEALLS